MISMQIAPKPESSSEFPLLEDKQQAALCIQRAFGKYMINKTSQEASLKEDPLYFAIEKIKNASNHDLYFVLTFSGNIGSKSGSSI